MPARLGAGSASWMSARRDLAAFVGGVLALSPAAAGGAEPDAGAGARATVVHLVGDAGASSELAALLGELLGQGHVRAVVSSDDRFDPALWLDAGEDALLVFVVPDRAGRLSLYFRAPPGERFLVRELSLPHGLDAVGREMVGQVVESSVAALLHSATAGIDRAQARIELARQRRENEVSGPPPPSVTGPGPRRWSALFAIRYDAAWSGSDLGAVHGPGLELGLFRVVSAAVEPDALCIGAAAIAEWALPQSLASRALDAEIDAASARLLASVEWRHGRHHSVIAALGGGADLVWARTTAVHDRAIAPAGESRRAIPTARAEVAYGVGVGAWRAALALFADVALEGTDYALQTSSGAVTLATPWRIRPGASLSFTFRPSF
jgi:hypothetical protein